MLCWGPHFQNEIWKVPVGRRPDDLGAASVSLFWEIAIVLGWSKAFIIFALIWLFFGGKFPPWIEEKAVLFPFGSQVPLLVKALATENASVTKEDRFIPIPWLRNVRQAVQQVFNQQTPFSSNTEENQPYWILKRHSCQVQCALSPTTL